MICDTKYQSVIDRFSQMKEEQIRIVALFALERLWMPFENGLPEQSKELKRSATRCLDILWQQALYKITDDIRVEYMDRLEHLNDSADEENPEDEFATPFPLYLIGQLFSGIISSQGNDLRETCASSTIRPLDMICDRLFDLYGEAAPFETHPIVQAELDRIDQDILLASAMRNPPYTEILKKRMEYRQLNILPD